jgi:anti-anti-sigma regulatory factor
MLELAEGWRLELDFSTEWLFLRLYCDGYEAASSPPLAERAWSIAEQYDIKRIVIEVDHETLLNSYLIGQFLLLHKRAHLSDGVMRLCGLSPENYRVIKLMQFSDRFPNYTDREHAVLGYQPNKPR